MKMLTLMDLFRHRRILINHRTFKSSFEVSIARSLCVPFKLSSKISKKSMIHKR